MAYNKSLVVDTSAFSQLLRGDEHVKGLVTTSGLVAMPIVVAAELRAGFLHGKKSEKYGPILDDFLADSCTVLLHITDDTIPIYAELYAYARSKGRQLSNNDFWIAALCIQYNHPLLTGDKDFDSLPQVRRIHLH